ncbi:hypothetical protein EDB81DRAFT_298726 [Dactylonectria macrodidyma]|uniref:Uncharacterized protein n=1 Tax=Dactylonectria macrodidyma TaxID=307937 RepID=A0A9P9IBC6_9HYPO|nr:hypothetical protein EDB81DRAFT_298726 [Dactylonectria macrodidyma]
MTSEHCSRTNYLHSVIRQTNPQWRVCLYCGENLSSSQSQRSSQPRATIDTIDLTDEGQLPSSTGSSDISQHASAPAMLIPTGGGRLISDDLSTAINEGNQSRSQHAQATRKTPKSQPFDLTIFFYTAGYKIASHGLLQTKKYQTGSPHLVSRITHCFITDPVRQFENHAEFVQSLIRSATKDSNYLRLDWQLISNCSTGVASSISTFPDNIYNTTSLVDFLRETHAKIVSPFKFSLILLYPYEATSDNEDPFTPTPTRKGRGRSTQPISSSPTKQPKKSQTGKGKRRRISSIDTSRSGDAKIKLDLKQEPLVKVGNNPVKAENDLLEGDLFVRDNNSFTTEDFLDQELEDETKAGGVQDTIWAEASQEGSKIPEFTMVTRQRTQKS